jgi:hypothetical protein
VSDDPGRSPRRLRAYALTQGRTDAGPAIGVDAMLVPGAGPPPPGGGSPEQQRILALCSRSPQTLVDLSAAVALPVQVVRVLLADLIASGAVEVAAAERSLAPHHDLALLEEVLHGIESL